MIMYREMHKEKREEILHIHMTQEEKEEIWLSPMTKAPTPTRPIPTEQLPREDKDTNKKFHYSASAKLPILYQ